MYVVNVGAWRYLEWMIDERLPNSHLRKMISEPYTGTEPQSCDDQWDALTIELPRLKWRAKVQVRHMCDLSSCHDMHLSSPSVLVAQWLERLTGHQVTGSMPRLGLRNRFSEIRAWRSFIYHSFKVSPILITLWLFTLPREFLVISLPLWLSLTIWRQYLFLYWMKYWRRGVKLQRALVRQ